MYAIALIPMAGSGIRFNYSKNKAFYPLLDKPIALYSLNTFQNNTNISEIIPIVKEDDMAECMELIENNNITKVEKIAPGGVTRQESVFHALKLVNQEDAIVLIHDGARPFVNDNLINDSISALAQNDGVVCAVRLVDTIKEIRDGYVKKTFNRDNLIAVQTPQTFHYKTLFKAYKKIIDSEQIFTDDAAIVEKNGGKIIVVPGSYENIKITTRQDVKYAEFILRTNKS
ncbi:2-C-methyl-D-erythritol 4-phosphate cytidylyltransferase [Candidatus Magnetoovum chiemensis]|nr:2-C-methyl-D-erythritol 4-phosphate cytidylyltransferase [Candidatus Magnetoovum chiemensis]